MIEEVIEMHKEYMDSNEAQMALEREREIYLKNTQIKDAKEEGEKIGKEIGKTIGKEIGKTIGKNKEQLIP